MEASDGNLHVKVFLHCPNCRSDLGDSIRYTLLLRKVDESLAMADDNPSESEQEFRAALETTVVKETIQEARKMEARYLEVDEDSEQDEENDESWGVEADLFEGAHESFHLPSSCMPQVQKSEAMQIDPTLLAGVQHLLRDHESILVTELMTSGDTQKLVEAALTLYEVAESCISPQQRAPSLSSTQQTPIRLTRHASVFDLIEEARNVRSDKKTSSSRTSRQTESLDATRRSFFAKNFPVPVRMPKVIELDLSRPLEMKFLPHYWNGKSYWPTTSFVYSEHCLTDCFVGTVMDAYSKISIGFGNRITQRRTSNEGVRRILGEHAGDVQIDLQDQKRILVCHVGRFEGKKGVVRGDVITHVDEISLAGKSVDELMILLAKRKPRGKVVVTFNAERSVAEALKRRAFAISKI